jgi:SAM-dependent methyltransferase
VHNAESPPMDSRAARVLHARATALSSHDEQATDFDRRYRALETDIYTSSFTYGRSKLDECLGSVLATLPQGARVLDVGCGTGEQVRRCRDLGLDASGVEPAPRMRSIAAARNPDCSITDGTAVDIPAADASVDMIIAIEVLRYLAREDVLRAYAEMLRVLRPGGVMFFTMVNRYALDGFWLKDSARRRVAQLSGRPERAHCEFTTPAQVRRDLAAAGATEVRVEGRMLAPLRLVYQVHPRLGARVARMVTSLDDRISRQPLHTPLAGHLVVTAKKP